MTAERNLYVVGGTHGTVVQTLGNAIVTGTYPPGTLIPTEEKLTTELGVSRPALREGIRVLAGKGLLRSTAGRGTIVQPPASWNVLDPDVIRWRYESPTTASAMDDLTGLRLVLEPAAARIAAESSSARILDPIEDALERMRASTEDTEAFVAADLDFHAAIVAATENQLLIHLQSVLAVALQAQRKIHTTSKTRHRRTLPAHARVLTAIRESNADQAEIEARDIVQRAHLDILYYTGRSRRSGASD
jgi:DNA-binding FadR family transcriptional regulator